MSITRLLGVINQHYGVATPSRYQTIIKFPSGLPIFIDNNLLSFTTEVAQLPGRQMATTPHTIYGVTRKMPYGVVYDDLNLTFICTNDMRARQIFDVWQSIISDPTNNYFNYLDNYKGEIEISKYDEQNIARYTIYVEECYPVTVQSQDLDANASDQYLRLNIQFAYRRWRTRDDKRNAGTAFSTTEPFYGPDSSAGSDALTLPTPIENKLINTSPKGVLSE